MEEYIEESGMKFGPFPAETVFHIEKSPQYTVMQHGMRITEFIYFNKEKLQLISLEAKKTAPNPNSISEQVDNPKEVFQKYISDIREKFENSLDLYTNLALKKDLPEEFKTIDYNKVQVVFMLVIKKHKREWLKDIKDALEMAIRSVHRTNKIWKCKVLVINEEMAYKNHLIKDINSSQST